LAIVVWLVVALAWMLTRRGTRTALRGVARALSARKIAVPLLLMCAYVSAVVVGLRGLGMWNFSLTTATVFWFASTALVLFGQFEKASRDPRFFRRAILGALSVTVLVSFLADLHPMNIAVEFILIPTLVLLGAMLALAEARAENASLRGLLSWGIAIVGFFVLGYSVLNAVEHAGSLLTLANGRAFALPVLLTASLMPFVYGLTVYGSYDGLLNRLRIQLRDDRDIYRRLRRRLLLTSRLRLRRIRRATHAPWHLLVPPGPSRGDIDCAIAHLRSNRPHALAMQLATQERISEIAATRAPGWEYLLFAARLEAGAAAVAQCPVQDESRRAFETKRNRNSVVPSILGDNREATEIVASFDVMFEPERVEPAFGAPGEPGDRDRIVALAETLILSYSRMTAWRARARATPVSDDVQPLVDAHAAMLDLAIVEVDAYIDRWIEVAADLPTLLERAGDSAEPIRIEMALVLTLDDEVLARFKAELAQLELAA
jgi:hypothetical protein